MINENVIFSVIVPVYNEGTNISKTLDSFVNQSVKCYEIIIVDDGSTDSCVKVCDDYAAKYENFIVYHKKNEGCVLSRKYGIERATGKYIIFADGDDFFEYNHIETLLMAVRNNADLYLLNNKLKFSNNQIKVEKSGIQNGYVDIEKVYQAVLYAKMGAVWDKIYLRERFLECLDSIDCPISFGEDIFINIVYLEKVKSAYYQDTTTYIHVAESATSICSNNITFARLDEMDKLFLVVYEQSMRNEHISKNMINSFCEFNVFNILNIINFQIKKHVSRKTIIDKLSNSKIYQYIINCYKPDGLKAKLYFYLLKNMPIKVIKILFSIRKVV